MATSDADKIEKLLEEERQLKARIRDLRARERERERKLQTRKKILIGAAILAEIEHGRMSEENLDLILDRNLSAERDRALFELPDEPSTASLKTTE